MSWLKLVPIVLVLLHCSESCRQLLASCCFVVHRTSRAKEGQIMCIPPPNLDIFPPKNAFLISEGELYTSVEFGKQCKVKFGPESEFTKYLPNLKNFLWADYCKDKGCIEGAPVKDAVYINMCTKKGNKTTTTVAPTTTSTDAGHTKSGHESSSVEPTGTPTSEPVTKPSNTSGHKDSYASAVSADDKRPEISEQNTSATLLPSDSRPDLLTPETHDGSLDSGQPSSAGPKQDKLDDSLTSESEIVHPVVAPDTKGSIVDTESQTDQNSGTGQSFSAGPEPNAQPGRDKIEESSESDPNIDNPVVDADTRGEIVDKESQPVTELGVSTDRQRIKSNETTNTRCNQNRDSQGNSLATPGLEHDKPVTSADTDDLVVDKSTTESTVGTPIDNFSEQVNNTDATKANDSTTSSNDPIDQSSTNQPTSMPEKPEYSTPTAGPITASEAVTTDAGLSTVTGELMRNSSSDAPNTTVSEEPLSTESNAGTTTGSKGMETQSPATSTSSGATHSPVQPRAANTNKGGLRPVFVVLITIAGTLFAAAAVSAGGYKVWKYRKNRNVHVHLLGMAQRPEYDSSNV